MFPGIFAVKSERIPSRIVVRGTNWVGDTVMSIPAIRELRRIFPSAWIGLWGPSGLEPLLRATGVPDGVIGVNTNSAGPLKRPFLVKRELASGRFDMAVLFQNAFEGAFTTLLAGIPTRVGYPTDLRGPLLTVKIPLTREIRQKHQVFYYLGITDFLRHRFAADDSLGSTAPDCSISLSDDSLGNARELLLTGNVDLARPLFCLCPGSVNSEAKRWPADYFARLADLVSTQLGAAVVFLGSGQERTLVEGIISQMTHPGAMNLAGQTDLIGSMAVMRVSHMVVSNDTGSAHMAVAAGSTVLTLFGPTSIGATAPYGPKAHTMRGLAPCAPCRHFRCPVPDHPCMRCVVPEDVLRKIVEIRAKTRHGI